jgi:glutaredoxin
MLNFRRWTVLIICVGVSILFFAPPVCSQARVGESVTVHYFRAEGCPHCEDAGRFLRQLAAGDPRIEIQDYEIELDETGRESFTKVIESLKLTQMSVPFIVVGDWAIMGYQRDEWTGAEIERRIAACLASECPDPVGYLLTQGSLPENANVTVLVTSLPEEISVPLLGKVQTASLSLPALTVVLGALDGFNPCAMWALVFLLGMLLGVEDRKRVWILGLAFLAGSGLVYFLIMTAWLNVLLAFGMVVWIRIAVGLVALGGSAYNLYDFFANPEAVCPVSQSPNRRQIMERLKQMALKERLWPALLGVVLLAIAVNLIEFVCSAGIPAVYTQLLTLSFLPLWQYYAYLLLYIIVFMADDILIFGAAVTTLQFTGLGTKYARVSRLLGGLILGVIGLALLFKPQWLSFR